MTMMKLPLQRCDIVGKKVKRIYHSPWYVEDDGFGGRATYIELENGTTFSLQSQDPGIAFPIWKIDLNQVECSPSTESNLVRCYGETVVEVLSSDYWPSLGLLLSNDCFLFNTDFPNANLSRALLMSADAEPVGKTYVLTDVVAYWEQPDP